MHDVSYLSFTMMNASTVTSLFRRCSRHSGHAFVSMVHVLGVGAASGATPAQGDHGLQRSSSVCVCERICCSCSLFYAADGGPRSGIFYLFLGVFAVTCNLESTLSIGTMLCRLRRLYEVWYLI